jgi:SWIM zinc finger
MSMSFAMFGPALDYNYRYTFASELAANSKGERLRLATCGGALEHPYFFQGRLTRPQRAADLLRGLAHIVQSRFHVPPAMLARILLLADPVITSSDDILRFEAFSACCSTYARVDLLPDALDGNLQGRGTTNVDFNPALRAALARIRDGDTVELSIGVQAMELSRNADSVVERKVPLPLRWLKGFVEVQAYQARMRPRLEVPGTEARRFLRSLPRGVVKQTCWVVPAGRGLRVSHRATSDGVAVGGMQRLRVLEDLACHARQLLVFAEDSSQTSTWVLVLDEARFHLVLSPEVWRGFSGEGQVLGDLANVNGKRSLARVQASLKWQSRIDVPSLATGFSFSEDAVTVALRVLGARGLVGFDLAEGKYFHRELPFDLSRLEILQPRLKEARKLLERQGVRIVNQTNDRIEALVAGTGVEHRVRVSAGQDRCTCPWFAKYRGTRGPCKHVLAVHILADENSSGDPK